MQASKREFKAERDNLAREIKNIQKHLQPLKVTKSVLTQTDQAQNNNFPTKASSISTCSISVQTSPCQSLSSMPAVIPDTLELFNCFVCDENFQEARNLKEHATNEHMIELQLSKLLDGNEETPFVRFVKSINMGDDYVSKRIKLYPEHWDQIEERINIRMMAQKKTHHTVNR